MKVRVVFEIIRIADALEHFPTTDRFLVNNGLDNNAFANFLSANGRLAITMFHVYLMAPRANVKLRNHGESTTSTPSLEGGEVEPLTIHHYVIDEEAMLTFLTTIRIVGLNVVANNLTIDTFARLQLSFDVFLVEDLGVDIF